MNDTDQDSNKRICVGVVTGAHGLRGLVRVRPFTDVPEDIAAYGPVESGDGERSFALEIRNRTGKGQLLVAIDGVADRTAAEALKGTQLFVSRETLPAVAEDEFYFTDLLGLAVVGLAGETVGTVRAVENFGGGDMLEIDDARGGVSTIPFTRAAVPEVDVAAGRVVVDVSQILRAAGNG